MIREVGRRQRRLAVAASALLAVTLAPLLLLNRRRHRLAPPMRILVLEPWGIGDVVLSTGAIRSLRVAYPDARITVLAKGYAEALVVDPELATDVIAYDFPWTAFEGKYRLSRYRFVELARLVLGLRRARYDLVLNARADIRNNVLGALIGGSRFVSVACGAGDFLATEVVEVSPTSHRSEDWHAVAERAMNGRHQLQAPRLTASAGERAAIARALGLAARDGRPIVGIHPGAAVAVRRWGHERFAHVANALEEQINARVVVFADPDGYGAQISLRARPVIVQRPLREVVAAISLCDILICSDSGLMHVANALGVPVVALFGPGQAEWFGPRGGPSRVVRVEEMPCRPCFDSCQFSVAHCMTQLPESEVVERTLELLQLTGPSSTAAELPARAARAPRMAVGEW